MPLLPHLRVAIRIEHGKMKRLEVEPAVINSLDWMHEQIGGYIEACLTDQLAGQERIVAWCDEDGLRKGLAPNVYRWDGAPIVGPILVLGCTREGDNRGLTEEETYRVALIHGGPITPLLDIRPPIAVSTP